MRSWLQRLWGAEGLALAAGVSQSIFAARLLGVRDFGVAALVIALPSMILMFLDPQSEEAVVRFATEARSQVGTGSARDVLRLAYRVDAGLAAVGLAIVTPFALVGVAEFGIPNGSRWLLAVGAVASAAAAPVATARAWLTSLQRFGDIAWLTSTMAIVRAVVSVGAAAAAGLAGYVVGVAAGAVIELVGALWVAHAATPAEERPSRLSRRTALDLGGRRREIVRFMIFTDLTTLTSVLVKHLDVLILGREGGPGAAGVYRLARSVSTPAGAVLRPLQTVSYPRLASLASAGNDAAFREQIGVFVRRLSLPLFVAGLLGVGTIPFLLPLLAGREYEGAVFPAVYLGAGSVAGIALFWNRPAALALRREQMLFTIGLAMTVLTVGGYILVAGPLGPPGVAAVRAGVAAVLGNLLSVLVVLRSKGRVRADDNRRFSRSH